MSDPVRATLILTLLDHTVPPSKVHVVNPKEILEFVSIAEEHRLNENLIRRICYQLDQKCKLEVE